MSNIPGLKHRRAVVAEEAARRWLSRADQRRATARNVTAGLPVDTESRRRKFSERQSRRPEARRFVERIIGTTEDFQPFAPDERARAAGRPVARIVSRADPRFEPEGFATGFMVAPRLLLTNYHVLPLGEDPGPCEAHFLYEHASNGINRGVFHRIDTRLFHLADETLDYALVAVEANPDAEVALEDIGYINLIPSTGKVLIGHPINVIQHPDGRPKQYATTENKLLDVLDEGFLHYTTDTLQGSSGSPVFNIEWEVVGLHHSSVPRMIDGRIVTRDSTPWDESMPEDEIEWIANEGTRISSIVRDVREAVPFADTLREELRRQFLSICEQADVSSAREGVGPESSSISNRRAFAPRSVPMSISIQVNPTITIHGEGTERTTYDPVVRAATVVASRTQASADVPGEVAFERNIRLDRNYSRKKGYSSSFLRGYDIPLPQTAESRSGEMWRKDGDIEPTVLKYHHFSLAMNEFRRMCMWTAVNVDYTPARRSNKSRTDFGKDTWTEDPRVPVEVQITDEEFYKPATQVDRGHIVRREDNCWGDSELEIEYANSDTFHWTNCIPQHEMFNREKLTGIWGRFESFITNEIGAVDGKVSIFAGPVLSESDPAVDYGFGPIEYPVRFWKVVAAVSSKFQDRLFVTGFVFDQSDVIDQHGLERIDFSPWKRNRKTLRQISAMTGVEFPAVLVHADTPATPPE